ncbi:MAG: PKD domain-containing protein [Flavobacteriales bacterium]|nr:PKD domain-containing protein [Flavobacteriales bacterium]
MKNIMLTMSCFFLMLFSIAQNCSINKSYLGAGSYTFAASSTGNIDSIYWDFGDGASSFLLSPTHTYINNGNYTINALIFDGGNICVATDTVQIGSSIPCSFYAYSYGLTLDLFRNGSGAIQSILWDFGDGNTSNQMFPSHTYSSAGTYNVCMTSVDTAGISCSFCDSVVITNWNGGSCYFSSTNSGPLTADFLPAVGVFATISWDFGDGNSSTQINPSHTYATQGVYSVCMTVVDTSGNACSYCDSVCVGTPIYNPCGTITKNYVSSNTIDFGLVYSGNIDSLLWDFGDGNTSSQLNPTHTYSSNGFYQVFAIIFDSGNICFADDTVNLGSGGSNNCSFYAAAYGLNVDLWPNTSNPIQAISWDLGDGNTSNLQYPSHTYTAPGTYNICMISIDLAGDTCTFCDTVTVSNNPGGGSCSFQSFTIGLTANVQANFASVNEMIMWDFGDGTTVTSVPYAEAHAYSTPGTYQVCMSLIDTISGNISCSVCDSIMVDSFVNCGATMNIQALSTGTYNFSLNYSGAIDSVFWYFGDGSGFSTQLNPTYTYTFGPPMDPVFAILYIGGNQCMVLDSSLVQPNPNPNNCQAQFLPVPVGLTTYFLDVSYVTNLGSVNYLWDFGDGNSSTLQFPNHTYAQPGIYQVCLTINDSLGCSSSFCDIVMVDTSYTIPPGCQAYFVPTQVNPYDLFLVNLSFGVNISFNWDFGDGTTSNLAYPSHTYAQTGDYNVCLTVSDGSCTDLFCDTIGIDSLGYLYKTANAVTVTVISPEDLTLFTEENTAVSDIDVTVFPNPTNGLFNVTFDGKIQDGLNVSLTDITGKTIQNEFVNVAGTMELDLTSYPNGVYMLQLQDESGYIHHEKIVKF